jgi:hypothetical protein
MLPNGNLRQGVFNVETDTNPNRRHPMTKAITTRRVALAALATAMIAGVAAPAMSGPFLMPTPSITATPEYAPIQVVSGISLSPGEFKGYDGRGKKQRVRIKTAGNGYTLQTLTGRNSGQVFYVDQGNNMYKAADGTTLQVTSRRSFVWNGWLGTISMND